jgi:formate hydrogenlyase subunit 3/multisubunit Na+/H+ antiporter MnhD subunit
MSGTFIFSMIFSILIVYFVGDISKILRNMLIMVIFAFSALFFLQVGGVAYDLNIFPSGIMSIGFSFRKFGKYMCLLNHAVFFIFMIKDMAKEKHESENSYFMNMLFLFFATNLLLFSKNIETAIVIYEITIYFILFLITTNINERKTVNDILFINSILSAIFIIALILLKQKEGQNFATLSYVLLIIVMVGRLFMIPFNSRFVSELKKAGIILLGYFMFVLFAINISLSNLILSLPLGISQTVINSSYLVFVPFMILSLLRALAAEDIKQMMFFLFTLVISSLMAYEFRLNVGGLNAIPLIFSSMVAMTVLLVEIDFIEETFLTTDLKRLGGISRYLNHSPLIFIMAFIALIGLPPISMLGSKSFTIDLPFMFKAFYVFSVFAVVLISFKASALLFFTESEYSGIAVFDYRKIGSRLYIYFLFAALIFILLFPFCFNSICDAIRSSDTGISVLIADTDMQRTGVFLNFALFIFILISMYLRKKTLPKTSSKPDKRVSEIVYDSKTILHSFDRNINLNGVNFYGYNEEKSGKFGKYADLDGAVRFLSGMISDIGGFSVKFYQRSFTAVFLIVIIFVIAFALLSGVVL